ncbi:TetR/AcrR family transcriptional regulator [Streptomyces solicathayae]|uniref:TetR/AcrR family transcriptional regulator n=1 Tax=Streptomyces solicathayae TaxID=3081768 RepID=A0ABZ0M403_9ACTN|nr:TetR/AcrR family transcriptional regulator [Streptomyces sp. HUAS YS2]WOX26388.1 TetR/AcrR family transcriptional regulator [Streptomyces sp. HUAS YS2]
MATARTPRGRWIDEGLRALSAGGPEAVRIEALAQALGVSKGGFYGYFRNRGALLTEMLDAWEYAVTDTVIEQVEADGGDAREKLVRLFAIVGSADAAGPSDSPARGTAVELAIRDWARRDEDVAERLRRVDNRRIAYMRSLFGAFCPDEAEVEARCLIAFSLRIGNHFIAADHGPRTRAQVLELTRKWLLG